ncbi:MAG: 1-deoxy-D-xylulose-5-phosphate synthase N-terminal domain-containing protein [Pseudomonadota bacterium]
MTFDRGELGLLSELERKVLWLASWTVHNANHVRPSRDGIKVGGHQSSSASVVTLMTALYFAVLRPEDRVAVKPHASPVFHAIQYLLGKQSQDQLERFRAFGGAQSYPSRTKDKDDVDFSTGSVGLGVGVTLFASLVQDYLRAHRLIDPNGPTGRMVALLGDAELDEGNIYEALLEGWKQDVRNLWWIVDYNRQSLDGVVNDALFQRIERFFANVGWRVVNIKYGERMQRAFEGPAGEALQRWIDDCPNQLYSALTFKGGAAWRAKLAQDLAGTSGLKELLDSHDDAALQALMTNLGGHDLTTLLEAFEGIDDDRPTCFVAYTIKGYGLPLAGHKDNHAGLMTPEQIGRLKAAHGIADGEEWQPFAGLAAPEAKLRAFLGRVPFASRRPVAAPARIEVPPLAVPKGRVQSTQEAFGRILNDLARSNAPLAHHVMTTSPDVTISTNLAGWVNQRAIYHRTLRPDLFREEQVASPLKWDQGPHGQHLELGIAENNLFLGLAAMGLAHRLFGGRILPIGTLYDPFIARGLDSLNYACYQDARFLLVATPSGISLAPEGGAHQSIATPLIGLSQDGLAAFEPAYADELACLMRWALAYLQNDGRGTSATGWERDRDGGSVYLRLSTRALEQPERILDDTLERAIIDGGYWVEPPSPRTRIVLVYQGVLAAEAKAAFEALREEEEAPALLAVTSADRLNAGWHAAQRQTQTTGERVPSHVERLLRPLPRDAALVTVLDGHPATLSWLGGVFGHRVHPLGVEHFGQSGDTVDLYGHHRVDPAALLDACAQALVDRLMVESI